MQYGKFDFAVGQLQKGLENDPLSIEYLLHLALIYLHGLRDYEKTRMTLNRILELDTHYWEASRPMSLSYLFEGKNDLTEAYARKYYDALEGKGNGSALLIMCLAASGEKDKAEQLYQLAKETLSLTQFSPSLHAKANAYLGRFDEPLNMAIEENDNWLHHLKYSPEWDLLRPDPRFKKVLERMNF
jgi:tetratricopeptide (TPR) repeat protein